MKVGPSCKTRSKHQEANDLMRLDFLHEQYRALVKKISFLFSCSPRDTGVKLGGL